jgi:hypothetical protein
MNEKTNLEPGEVVAAVDSLRSQATDAVQRLAEQLEVERRMQENPMGTLALAAGAGFLLGGGLWPVLRPFAKAMVRTLMSPQNLIAIAAAAGALQAARSSDADGGAVEGGPTA